MLRILTTLLLLLAAAPVRSETSLTPHSATYDVKISVLGGELTTKLEPTATGFVATHVIRATGMSRMLARGSIAETTSVIPRPRSTIKATPGWSVSIATLWIPMSGKFPKAMRRSRLQRISHSWAARPNESIFRPR